MILIFQLWMNICQMLLQLERFHDAIREDFQTHNTLRDVCTVLDKISEPVVQITILIESSFL